MSENPTETINVNDLPEELQDLPKGLQSLLADALSKVEDDPLLVAGLQFTHAAHDVFEAMLLCTLISHKRASEKSGIHDLIITGIGKFVSKESGRIFKNRCQDSLDTALFNVMLQTRALTEDALGVKRHDGTAKGSEANLL
jgi:hypothetical protein